MKLLNTGLSLSFMLHTYVYMYPLTTLPTVDFMESFLQAAQYTSETGTVTVTPEQMTGWQLFKPLYDSYVLNCIYDTRARIPKIIHHIWLGSPLPDRYKRFINTWKTMHPTWTHIVWDDAKVAQLGLVNQRAYERATNYGERSDIARYEILYRFGGVYVDTDFACLQPFDVLHHCCDFYTGAISSPGGGGISVQNGLIGSRAKHPILKRCIAGIKKSDHNNDPSAIMRRTGPAYFLRCIIAAITKKDPIQKTVIFPPTFFYPWPHVFRSCKNWQETIESCLRPESFAVHYWAASWAPDIGLASCDLKNN